MYKNAFTTYLIDGVIWITKPKFPYKSLSFAMKDYHVGDVNLFWEDIRLNTKHRLVHWFSKEDSSKTMKKLWFNRLIISCSSVIIFSKKTLLIYFLLIKASSIFFGRIFYI